MSHESKEKSDAIFILKKRLVENLHAIIKLNPRNNE